MATNAIDPGRSFPFLALSGAGGHFHALLPLSGLKTLFVGSHLGLFRSEDRGLTWRLAAARFSGEDVHGVGWAPTAAILYAATHRQGLLVSRDGGRRWSDTGGLPGRDLHALALDPRRSQTLYVWVVDHGLFRSDDGGGRWRKAAGPGALHGVASLAVHPRQSERLYAGTAKGVWASDDGGVRWHFPAGGLAYKVEGVSVPSWRPGLLFAATLEGAFVGKADGTEWHPLSPHPSWWGLITGFGVLADRPEGVFVVSHEGVIAAQKLTGGDWIPAAELSNLDSSLSQK